MAAFTALHQQVALGPLTTTCANLVWTGPSGAGPRPSLPSRSPWSRSP